MGARSFESGRWEGAGSIIPVYDPLSKALSVPWECNGEEALQPIEVLMQQWTWNGVRHHRWLGAWGRSLRQELLPCSLGVLGNPSYPTGF